MISFYFLFRICHDFSFEVMIWVFLFFLILEHHHPKHYHPLPLELAPFSTFWLAVKIFLFLYPSPFLYILVFLPQRMNRRPKTIFFSQFSSLNCFPYQSHLYPQSHTVPLSFFLFFFFFEGVFLIGVLFGDLLVPFFFRNPIRLF